MDNLERIALLAEMLEVEEEELTKDTMLEDIETWDSVAAISLLALMDEKFDKRLSGTEIKAFKTIGDILKVMV